MKTPTIAEFEERSRQLSLLEALLRETVIDVPADTSAASRSKQLTVLVVLYLLRTKGMPLSLTTLTEMTGMTRLSAQEALEPLIGRGLIAETWGRTSLGRGKAKVFHFTPELLQKLGTA